MVSPKLELANRALQVRIPSLDIGVKVSIATTVAPSRGGQFVLAAKALPGNPYDGHTLSTVIPHVQNIIGNEIKRIIADKGYRGHGAPAPHSESTSPSRSAA